MRITIVTGPFLSVPPAPCGAVERIWNDLAKEMARAGHEITIVCRDHEQLPTEPTRDGIRYVAVKGFLSSPSLPFNLIKDFAYGLRVLRKLPPADITVLNSFWLPALAPLMRKRAGRIVVNVQRMPKRQMGLYLRAGVGRLSGVSLAVKKFILAECPRAEPIVRVIPNPIATDIFVPPAAGRPRRAERIILYTGRIAPEKGLDLLVSAFALLRRTHKDIVLRMIGAWKIEEGGGGESYRERLRAIAPGDPIEFIDPIYDRHKLLGRLHEADFYCYPSIAERGETFGVAPLEAMATGLPPIVSALACFQDFVEDGVTGTVFDHRSADATEMLAAALENQMTNEEAFLEMGRRGVEQAQGFSLPRIAALYLDDWKTLLR